MTETISERDAGQLLEDLVSIESPSSHERNAVEALVAWMNAHGYDDAYVDEVGNAMGIIGNGTRDIVLLGHIDTFAGNPPVKLEGRLLYGRGSVDAKGSLCTFAVSAAQASIPDDVRLIVVGAVGEEAGSEGARHLVNQFSPECCLIGEPSQWDRITLGYKGRLILDYRWQGAMAHNAGQAMTAPEHAVAYWRHVQQYVANYNGDESRIFGQLDATLQEINSGQDGAFGWASAVIGFRLPPNCDPYELAEALDCSDGEAVTITAHGHETAHVGARDSVLSRALRGAIRAESGSPRFVHKTGTSDMNVVAPIWRCPIAAYGPGDSTLDHTPQEHIDLDDYLRAIRVLTNAIARF
ncbi:MAG: [LysW]-lysine hydrolase [Chloroflexota bacterium]